MVQRPDRPGLWGDGVGQSSGVAWRRVDVQGRIHPSAEEGLVALPGGGALARDEGGRERGPRSGGPGGGQVVQAEPRAGGAHEAGHRAVLGAGCLCVQRPRSARDSVALGAPRGPQPLPALKKAQGRGVWALVARQLSRRSLPQHPACPPRWPRLPACPLWGRTSGRQVSEAQGRALRPRAGLLGAACLWL